jgi:hypothetical protein
MAVMPRRNADTMMGRPRWPGTVLLAIGLAAVVSGPVVAVAQTDAPASYTGDLWSRPRLSGDWWESRDWLAKRGVTLDLDLLQILQGVATGGVTQAWRTTALSITS